MADGYTTRRLDKYVISAHNGDDPVDYAELMSYIRRTRPERRVYKNGRKVVVIPRVRQTGDYFLFTACEGDVGVAPVIMNMATAEERVQTILATEAVIQRTHGVIRPSTREVVVEYVHRGAKSYDVRNVLETAGRQDPRWPELSVSFAPVAQSAFWEELQRFERIRVASVRLARPNRDWTDHKNRLTSLAKDSKAESVSVEVKAPRGTGLAQDDGLLAFMISMRDEPHPTMLDAKVQGRREDDAREATISLKKYHEHRIVNVPTDDNNLVVDTEIEERLMEYLRGDRAPTVDE